MLSTVGWGGGNEEIKQRKLGEYSKVSAAPARCYGTLLFFIADLLHDAENAAVGDGSNFLELDLELVLRVCALSLLGALLRNHVQPTHLQLVFRLPPEGGFM